MRSRPKLEVFVKPAHPTAGSTVVVTARLTSSSETPIDGVEFRLSGTERRFSHDSGGDNSTRVFKTSSIVSLAARSNPEQLHVGTREVQASFPMPLYLPPTYEDPQSSIRYELTVRVDIPWWPDRVATYAIVVEPPRFRAEARGPVVFSTNTSGPQPKMPYIEVTFDPGALCRGGALSGAISVANLPAKTKTIEAELVAINDATFPASPPRAQTTRFAWHVPLVADGTETSSPFTLGIPEDVHPSFAAGLFTLGWALKFSASAGWGKGVELLVPVVIATDGPANVDPTKLRRLPPVGRERRARVWALVAQRQGLENDAESETMRARVGPVELSIELESRKDEGLCSVATLVWPPLGIDLSVRERKWSDALSRGDLAETDPAFDKRFVARARERAQSGAFLEGDLARMLAKTRSATLDDDGAVVMAIGGGHKLEQLEEFVALARQLSAAIASAIGRIPPPARAADRGLAWRDFAAVRGGWLEPGSLSIRGLRHGDIELDLVHAWSDAGEPLSTTCVHRLPPEVKLASDEARAVLADAAKEGVELANGELRASCPTLPADPTALDPVLERVAGAALRLTFRGGLAPYRT